MLSGIRNTVKQKFNLRFKTLYRVRLKENNKGLST